MATQEAGDQPVNEVDKLPSQEEMSKMSHSDLYILRAKNKSKEAQDVISPYEHRAFAREYVEENPVVGTLGMIGAIPGYQAVKAAGSGSRSGVSGKQVVEGFKGVAEGVANAVKKPWERLWNNPSAPALEPSPALPTRGAKPWEKNWGTVAPPAPIRPQNDAEIAQAVKLTPAEQAKSDKFERSAGNIAELKQEIAKATNPKNKKILEDELANLTGTVTNRQVDERFQKDPDPTYQLSNQYNERKFNELEKSASKVPEFGTIVSFLKDRNALPKLKPIYNGNRGEFTYGSGVAPEGELGIDMSHFYDTSKGGFEPSKAVVSTYIHEHTHAAVRQIRQLQDVVNSKPASERSAQEKQFLDTYSKLLPATMNNDFRSGITRIAQSINAEWVKKHSDYRASDAELPAYAVGNQFKKGKDYDTPDHVDPSIATTFMILLDQAKKVGKK